jgi:lipoyl-dependent peroxiredoxin
VKVLYQTAARATGGGDGRSATLDGTFEVSLTTPKKLGSPAVLLSDRLQWSDVGRN